MKPSRSDRTDQHNEHVLKTTVNCERVISWLSSMDPSHSFLPNGTFTTNCEFDQFGVTQVQSTPSLHFGTGGMVESEGMEFTIWSGAYLPLDAQFTDSCLSAFPEKKTTHKKCDYPWIYDDFYGEAGRFLGRFNNVWVEAMVEGGAPLSWRRSKHKDKDTCLDWHRFDVSISCNAGFGGLDFGSRGISPELYESEDYNTTLSGPGHGDVGGILDASIIRYNTRVRTVLEQLRYLWFETFYHNIRGLSIGHLAFGLDGLKTKQYDLRTAYLAYLMKDKKSIGASFKFYFRYRYWVKETDTTWYKRRDVELTFTDKYESTRWSMIDEIMRQNGLGLWSTPVKTVNFPMIESALWTARSGVE